MDQSFSGSLHPKYRRHNQPPITIGALLQSRCGNNKMIILRKYALILFYFSRMMLPEPNLPWVGTGTSLPTEVSGTSQIDTSLDRSF